ncbi:sensor histidine kinase [Capillimicrobium parvum]|uniref:histidine kinase n=1 Tax=Capillimicrobium parvum TaxID=2884022 RepID=A0A9E6XVL2_9ACTN|nr:sensor histidine kinase [Capillimicrobium parvum]UGS34581.1 Oxygen sensor histidine kinase NreB [Capillimicrobium parvum]
MALLWRVFATNAAVLVAATLVLVLTPATVSFPLAAQEAVVLAVGLALLLGLDFLLLRRAVGRDSLERVRGMLAAQEGERLRVARELHDEVGQTLTAVLLSLERTPSEEELAGARETVRAALDDVRSIARRLRPEALDDLGLTSALAALTVSVQRATGLRVERELRAPAGTLGDEEELVAYRVAQEALTNVARHAGATRAVVRTAALPGDGFVLEVADDGRGFDPRAATTGAGLLGMRERAGLIGARLAIDTAPGAGTTVRLEIGS